ncbi:MAG: Hpt domain-containing protein [Candidatus Theseobacter exili]|nr:Hpt domain-containing protein [Candidatus Theseobacter exili]
MELSEYKQLFLSEAEEILNSANNVLVKLEKESENMSLLNDLFRYSHTLKSMAQSMEYEDIVKLTHSMENILSLLRSGGLKTEKYIVELLFKSLDTLSDLVEDVKKGKMKKGRISPLVEKFEKIASAIPKAKRKTDIVHSTKQVE